jgi:hypothetical protein
VVTRIAIAEIARQPVTYPIKDWISHLAELVYEPIGQRLQAAHLVERVRGTFGKRRWVPIDPTVGASPSVLLYYSVDMLGQPRGSVDEQTCMLAGLALATGLEVEIASTDAATVRSGLRELAEHLPAELLEILGTVQAAVRTLPLRVKR